MAYEVFEIERDGHVATLWLANPSKRNAMGPAFWSELPRAIEELAADESVRAIVVAARGAHFTVGLDLKAMGGGLVEGGRGAGGRKRLLDFILKLQRSITAVARCEKPVIAVAHGWCIGGGIDLLTACDIRIAAADVVFSIRETRMAMVADVGTLQRLPGIIGRGQVAELALSGDDFGAERALALGFVNHVHPDQASALAAARALAARIAANSPLAVTGTKRVLEYCADKSVEDGLTYVATWNAAFVASEDLQEAVAAFMEKRAPTFHGR
ncbi:MAG: enoyl-CoA hydratase [Polyangiaceae bacterium UTPRO1]|jgi:enoyl-CoA hydratase|nr:crotonase/enoyl-CoA hydratase family protein [Myxococcales bacterium]OQY67474.1 MAG: enoyl-CoA hydratase [Polyangiaceae bacterium UTPRO1]